MLKTNEQGHEVYILAPTESPRHAIYAISEAAAKVGTTVQTLRFYEVRGLIHPQRTAGGTRRYSAADIRRLDRLVTLTNEGVNLTGISVLRALPDENNRLRTTCPVI